MGVRAAPNDAAPAPLTPTTREIPYDYVARFVLQGERSGNRVQDVINISTDGAFVAVSIGYSFIPAPLEKPEVDIDIPSSNGVVEISGESGITINTIPIRGDTFPLNVLLAILRSDLNLPEDKRDQTISDAREILVERSVASLAQCLLARACGIDFKYSIIDSGSGRELQNQPIHNIAGLGEPAGERPFRPLAKPMLFMPRSTIRIEVEEVSIGPIYAGAELFIVFHGYKMLGYGTGLP
jgi:hypothetical protein